jgi:superfamily II DNA/RNA helicase
VVERLYRLKWGRLDGLGALVISPTRELALQIFDELRKVGARHDLSAGLLIGGKNVKQEAERIDGAAFPSRCAACWVVSTPWHPLLHHGKTEQG